MSSSTTKTTTSTQKHVKSLNTTRDALTKIRQELKPFIKQLDSDNPQKQAQAQAVVALSMGTMRYMGARLLGKNEGRSKEDPLRQELDHMRKVLVELEAKHKHKHKSKSSESSSKAKKDATPSKKEAAVVEKKEEAKSPAKSNKRPTPTKESSTPGRSVKKSRKK